MQPELLEALADEVAQTINGALAPVLTDVKALQGQVATWEARWNDVGALRERVAVVETKAAQAPPVAPEPPAEPDTALVDLRARVASLEPETAALRDRVVAVETKAAIAPPAPDLGDVRDRLVALETRQAGLSPELLADVRAQVKALEPQAAEIPAMRERLAVLETRAPVPGPAGTNGQDGLNGKDGADGIGFDDLTLVQENDRTVIVRGTVGTLVKEIGTLTFPVEIYRDVYQEGRAYERGDCVTWAGSEWHCNEPTTTKPGEGSKAWRLKVKRGRDGKDGRDAPGALPVVSR